MPSNNSDNSSRTPEFTRNKGLEDLLVDINESLSLSESSTISAYTQPELPIILIMGPLRSGTTLLTQWLANTGLVSYPTNLLSRFYAAPVIGAKIQLLLTDPRYNFRNELGEFSQNLSYTSDNGKTTGVLAPNEFWYFWRRFLANPDRDDHTDEILQESMDTSTMLKELAGLVDVFKKPFACKGMLFNYNINFLSRIISKPIFIHIHRKPLYNMQSALQARERQLGSRERWYSFKIKEYEELSKHDHITQVAGQIYHINSAITDGLEAVSEDNKIVVDYENFCDNPEATYKELLSKLRNHGYSASAPYNGPSSFKANETWRGTEKEAAKYIEIYDSFRN